MWVNVMIVMVVGCLGRDDVLLVYELPFWDWCRSVGLKVPHVHPKMENVISTWENITKWNNNERWRGY